MAALQYVNEPGYSAIIFRRTYADLALPDALMDRAHRWFRGSATAFLGGVNESASAWKVNYELLWEDKDPETIAWVQQIHV